MRAVKNAVALAASLLICAGATHANQNDRQPAEFPPPSYTASQYVDSRGCVFVRTGIAPDVAWVPRMTRGRQVICGFQPSLGTSIASAPAPAPAAAPAPITAPVPIPKGPVVRSAPQPAPPASAPVVSSSSPAYVGRPVPSEQVTLNRSVTSDTRIVPEHIARARVNTQNVGVPYGYEPVWSDGRLNPHRAEQTLQGRSDMSYIWTDTVPRRLVNTESGRDVTESVPLIYPYTDFAHQRRALGEVELVYENGEIVKRVVRVASPTYLERGVTPNSRQPIVSR